MDLNQRKLSKAEWESIEVPVSQVEKNILQVIIQGYNDVNLRINHYNSMFTFLKIEYSEQIEDYIYNKYFEEIIQKIWKDYCVGFDILNKNENTNDSKEKKDNAFGLNITAKPVIKKADIIRMEQNNTTTLKKNDIYEYVILSNVEQMVSSYHLKKEEWQKYYFTLYKLMKNNIPKINRHIVFVVNFLLNKYEEVVDVSYIIHNAVSCIERNDNLLKYADMTLYEHQKEIITACKSPEAKLILYIAPTGTGKTMSPLAISEKHKIIFVCAARHVGVSLARAAISMNKKIAFAFGCASAGDIRLHYFAAKEYTVDKRSGGIRKVDNSIGDKVEIMICDIKSYLPAMYYMTSFNSPEKLIVYWDEPTITLDYESHDFHDIIQNNWKENIIPNMVLSSATLPKLHELTDTVADFKSKFDGANIINIVSHDCKKSIPMINKEGYVVLPHYLTSDYDEMCKIVEHTENYLTLLRYFDLKEVVEFIEYINKNEYSTSLKMSIARHFTSLDDIDMKNIKIYYLKLLKSIDATLWPSVYEHFVSNRKQRICANPYIDAKGNKIFQEAGLKRNSYSIGPGVLPLQVSEAHSNKPLCKIQSVAVLPDQLKQTQQQTQQQTQTQTQTQPPSEAIYITTKDAFTLTDGPSIFLSNDVEKIAKFYIQQANIPAKVMEDLMKKIEYNNVLNEKINILEKQLEDISEKRDSAAGGDGGSSNKKDCRKINREPSVDGSKLKKSSSTDTSKSDARRLREEIEVYRTMIKPATLIDTFIPNTISHLAKWAENIPSKNAFTSNVEERIVNDIMLLHGIEDSWKVLLMMGIGVFTNHNNIAYTEIMKKMADEQKLYMIIASSDYIYGTNYQFCHGFLSKDLNLTQEKIIQAMGRIGRNNIQQDYSVRFRDNVQINKLFTSDTEKPEIINMNRLFNTPITVSE